MTELALTLRRAVQATREVRAMGGTFCSGHGVTYGCPTPDRCSFMDLSPFLPAAITLDEAAKLGAQS